MTERKQQRKGSNSASRSVQAFKDVNNVVDLPYGYSLSDELEESLWTTFTRARSADDWRDMDLILVHKLVKMESDLRKQRELLEAEGYILTNQRGTDVENPRVRIMDSLERRQLAVIRSMSLNVTSSDPRTVKKQAADDDKARKTIKTQGVESLLASPMN